MGESGKGRKLGLWMSTSLVVGNMIGAGVFLMPAALAAYGGISILGWIVSAVGAFLLAKVFGRLSALIPGKNGGPYAYSRAGFGEFIGFLVAWGYWISTWVSNAAIAVAFVGAITVFFPVLAQSSLAAVLTGLGVIWFLTWVNSLGIRQSGTFQLVTTILKILPITVVILGGFFYFTWDNFTPLNMSRQSSAEAIAITAAMTLFAFLGLESATIPAQNIIDPEKNIPRATLFGTLLTTAFYILSTAVILGMIPPSTVAGSPAPFADAMEIIGGEPGRYLIAGGVAIAALGALNGWILVQGNIANAIAKDNLFPGVFRMENKNGVPILGLIVGSLLSSLLMMMNFTEGLVAQFRFMILLSTLCCLVPFLFSMASYVILILESKGEKARGYSEMILGGLAFLFSLWAVFGAGERAVYWGFLLLLAGIPLFVRMKWKNRNPD